MARHAARRRRRSLLSSSGPSEGRIVTSWGVAGTVMRAPQPQRFIRNRPAEGVCEQRMDGRPNAGAWRGIGRDECLRTDPFDVGAVPSCRCCGPLRPPRPPRSNLGSRESSSGVKCLPARMGPWLDDRMRVGRQPLPTQLPLMKRWHSRQCPAARISPVLCDLAHDALMRHTSTFLPQKYCA
jgi:hypothetical protein